MNVFKLNVYIRLMRRTRSESYVYFAKQKEKKKLKFYISYGDYYRILCNHYMAINNAYIH